MISPVVSGAVDTVFAGILILLVIQISIFQLGAIVN